jgi:hypothetical protein
MAARSRQNNPDSRAASGGSVVVVVDVVVVVGGDVAVDEVVVVDVVVLEGGAVEGGGVTVGAAVVAVTDNPVVPTADSSVPVSVVHPEMSTTTARNAIEQRIVDPRVCLLPPSRSTAAVTRPKKKVTTPP